MDKCEKLFVDYLYFVKGVESEDLPLESPTAVRSNSSKIRRPASGADLLIRRPRRISSINAAIVCPL